MKEARWLGHSTFLFTLSSGERVLIDPFLAGNPITPQQWKDPGELDFILLTHAHDDHAADTLELAAKTGAGVVSIVEFSGLLKADGLPAAQALEMNKGGTLDLGALKVTMTHAQHSSSWKGVYAGEPAGFILHTDSLRVYHAGDTNIMRDFELYGELYRPNVALLPIGDHYTMGPEEAALACRMLQAPVAIPMHYGTMPVLSGTPEEFERLTHQATQGNTSVVTPKPGEDFLPLVLQSLS